MGDQRSSSGQPEFKRPDEMVKDLEPDAHLAEAVKGGDLKIGGVAGESQNSTYKNQIQVQSGP